MSGRPRHATPPEGFRDHALNHSVGETRAFYRIGHDTFHRLCTLAGVESIVVARRSKRTTLPADFAEFAAIETNDQLCARYGVTNKVITRLRKESGIAAPMPRGRRIERPARLAEIAPTITRNEAMARFGISDTTLRRFCNEAGVLCRPDKRAKRFRTASLPTPVSSHGDCSLAGQAQRHLQRLMPVVKASVIEPKTDGYLVGGRLMATEQMVAMAQAKGFDPHAWERI